MKNLYEIMNWKGIHLCYQVAESEKDAVRMYGHRSAHKARFIRED